MCFCLVYCLSLLVFKLFESLWVLEEKYDHRRHVSFVSTSLPSGLKGLEVLGH